MSDFLHSLRSGKFKRTDNRSYNDPQHRGSNRRNENGRRQGVQHQLAAVEQITASVKDAFADIKSVLEGIAANQDRLTDAIEGLAEILKLHLQGDIEPKADQSGGQTAGFKTDWADSSKTVVNTEKIKHEQLLEQILGLRKKGFSFEKIAQQLDSEGVPTISGKGKWRGQTVSRLCKQIN
jgi:hypothetical protein